MATRLWTVLLLLAAVFAMHGLQCNSAADGAASDSGWTHTAAAALAAPAADHTAPAGHIATAAHTATVGHTARTPPVAAAAAEHGSGSHDSAAHLWALCLAVLAVGLAAMLALRSPTLRTLVRRAPAQLRARMPVGLALPRPPDLHVLCLLRT